MINARSETAATKPAFRDALKLRRCLVPADGFYEWQKTGKTKQPYCFEVNEGELFAFAGLWERWKDPGGKVLETCSILTTTPNAVTSAVHDRMPVILDPDSYDVWLDPGMTNADAASDMLKPYSAHLMRCYPVSARINHVANDDEGCSIPVELTEKLLDATDIVRDTIFRQLSHSVLNLWTQCTSKLCNFIVAWHLLSVVLQKLDS